MSSTVVIPPADLFPTTGTGDAVLATSPTLVTPISASLTAPTSTALTLTGGTTGASLVLGSGASGAKIVGQSASSPMTLNIGQTGTAGTSIEMVTSAGLGYIQHFNRTSVAYVPLEIAGEYVQTRTAAGISTRVSSTGNLLIGTTTDMSGVTGGLKIASTSASVGSTSGALQVAGGIYAGAASVFGGEIRQSVAGGVAQLWLQDTAAAADEDKWAIQYGTGVSSLFRIRAINDAESSGANALTISRTGTTIGTMAFGGTAATFAGALSTNGLFTVTGSGTETSVATAKVGASALGGIPRLNLINPTNTANGKYGDLINTSASGNGALQFRFIDDALASATPVFSVTGRQGATDSFVTAPGTGTHTFGTTNTVTMTAGALTATGAVAIGNTVAAAVAVASTHKVTMVIGGVTYYLLASNV